MRKLYFLLACVTISFLASAQKYCNEWINYSQKYYKIKVINNGIYRIDSATLAKAGINLDTIDPRRFQVFYHGQEQYIYVQGESTGVFSGKNNDYIEFFGQRNTGSYNGDAASDSLMYNVGYYSSGPQINQLPNPYYSLFNDTATYYFTWNGSKSNRRMAPMSNTTYTITPSNYFIDTTVEYGEQYFEGFWQTESDGAAYPDPRYTPAKGWFNVGLDFNFNPVETYSFNVSNAYTSGPNAFVKTLVAGASTNGINDHNVQISASWGNVWDSVFTGFSVFTKQYSVPASKLTGSISLTYTTINIPTIPDQTSAVAYIYVQYPHTPNLGNVSNQMMFVPDNSSAPNTYYNFTNLNVSSSDTIRLYDLTNHRRILVTQNSGNYQVLIPNSGGNKQCFITSDMQVNKVTNLVPVGTNLVTGLATGYFTQFSSVDSAYIMITHPSLWAEAYQYYQYRKPKRAVLVSAEELYDQFCYGIEKDPLAIRNFCNFAINTWHTPPQYLFLIGKGIHDYLFRQDPVQYTATMVPSFGYPSSDVLLTAGINGTILQPALATGRIAATNTSEVGNYLAKIKTYESTPAAQWQKRVIHFCGGSTLSDQTLFSSDLNAYAQIVSDTFYGGNVYTFKKTTADPIQITLADSVAQLINNGVSIMTFFGHASGNSFDENIDAPGDYSNYGKYPMIIADACFSGDIFAPVGTPQSSTSEQFVLDVKGSIGFLATDDLGLPGDLFYYTDDLYSNFSYKHYRSSLGKCIQNVIKDQQTFAPSDMQYTCLEMTLHADPAVVLLPADTAPDFAVSDSSIYFTPSTVTTQLDSFKLSLIVINNGEAVNKHVQVDLTRVFADGSDTVYHLVYKHIFYQDTITIKLPVNKVKGVGLNRFYINVDPSNLIKEITKINNVIGSPGILLWITSGDIVPVYPYQFAIIPHDSVTLKASTGDPFAPLRNYIFELDTNGNFGSPFLKVQIVSARGGVVEASPYDWVSYTGTGTGGPGTSGSKMAIKPVDNGTITNNAAAHITAPVTNSKPVIAKNSGAINLQANTNGVMPGVTYRTANGTRTFTGEPALKGFKGMGTPLMFKDSCVYYWRVRRDTTDAKDYGWQESSFQYIPGKYGWAQANYYQFVNNNYTFLNANTRQRDWVFDKSGRTLVCNTYGINLYNPDNTDLWGTGYKLDLTEEAYAGCTFDEAICVAVIDPITLQPWNAQFHPGYGNANAPGNGNGCSPNDGKFIFWHDDPTQMGGLRRMLDSIPVGDYILVWTWVNGRFRSWADTSAKVEFVKLGASPSIYTRKDSVPWIFFVQKGNLASVVEKITNKNLDSLEINVPLLNNEASGSMVSSVIGPAVKWDSISWRQHSTSKAAKDSVRMSVIGVDQYGNSKTLLKGVPPMVANMYITSINAKQYPTLQLMLYTKDTVTHTPSQMDKWQVFYTPVPEVAVNPSIYYSFYRDTLQLGDTVRFKTVVQNISDFPMDSMVLNSWVADAGNASHPLAAHLTKKLNPGDTAMISTYSSTIGYPGNNSIWMEVNPQFIASTRPEQYHFNNLAKMNFGVTGINVDPLLDVTFDGIHILNNDIVSAHPNILIQLTDYSKYLALDLSDTNKIAIYIRNVNSPTAQRVYISNNPQIVFTPANLPENRCKVLYSPTLTDGTYELSVQGADRSGTVAATNVYKIDFQVINKPMITNVLNYPNPFTTSTRFVFTVTGDQPPTVFKIQIMTITGKIVKEITEAEIGPLHVGLNITQYAWDGTDQFGDRLANGVYLYHVVATLNGQNLENMALPSDVDQTYFKNGWGKMYLMR